MKYNKRQLEELEELECYSAFGKCTMIFKKLF